MTTEQRDKFQEACYDQNTIDELLECLKNMSADQTDIADWNITATEWRAAIVDALSDMIDDLKVQIK